MFLAQISDTHLLSLKGRDPRAMRRADNLERCVATINHLPTRPQAVVHTGDMVNFDDNNGYGLAREILSQLKTPFFPTVGNRDSRSELINHFLAPEILSKDAAFCQYRISLDTFDLVCIDSKCDTRNMGTSCAGRLVELQMLMQQDTSKPVFIFLHHPPARIEALKNPLQFVSANHASALTDLLDRYDNIVRILCGHTHRSDILEMGRHAASTHPSLATDVRLDHYPESLVHEPVFQLHQLHDDHHVTSMSHFAARQMPTAA
jgi:3',5'-cyclic AMP phosphodiesterase CpdA